MSRRARPGTAASWSPSCWESSHWQRAACARQISWKKTASSAISGSRYSAPASTGWRSKRPRNRRSGASERRHLRRGETEAVCDGHRKVSRKGSKKRNTGAQSEMFYVVLDSTTNQCTVMTNEPTTQKAALRVATGLGATAIAGIGATATAGIAAMAIADTAIARIGPVMELSAAKSAGARCGAQGMFAVDGSIETPNALRGAAFGSPLLSTSHRCSAPQTPEEKIA